MGGTRAVPVALEKLARSLGVEFRTGLEVNRIVARPAAAWSGVETEGWP